jgi:hypothetical protein
MFEGIENTLGRYFKIDLDWIKFGLLTYARIFAEINISKGLPNKLILQRKGSRWTRELDYENTTS